MTSPAPGWYPDPLVPHQMRWWDGNAWSGDTYERAEPYDDWSRPRTGTALGAAAGAAESTRPVTTTDDGATLAGWWPRAAARLVDGALTGLVATAFGWSQAVAIQRSFSAQLDDALRASQAGQPPPPFAYDQRTLLALGVLTLVWLLVSLGYDLAFLLWRGATPGKLLLRLRVRRWAAGEPLTPTVVVRRWMAFQLASTLSTPGAVYTVIDVLWPLRDRRRRALHDRFAGTCVVTTPAPGARST